MLFFLFTTYWTWWIPVRKQVRETSFLKWISCLQVFEPGCFSFKDTKGKTQFRWLNNCNVKALSVLHTGLFECCIWRPSSWLKSPNNTPEKRLQCILMITFVTHKILIQSDFLTVANFLAKTAAKISTLNIFYKRK